MFWLWREERRAGCVPSVVMVGAPATPWRYMPSNLHRCSAADKWVCATRSSQRQRRRLDAQGHPGSLWDRRPNQPKHT